MRAVIFQKKINQNSVTHFRFLKFYGVYCAYGDGPSDGVDWDFKYGQRSPQETIFYEDEDPLIR